MCNFCHAPEHAYDLLLEDQALSRSELCLEAHERLRMAATPLPTSTLDATGVGLEYEWDEQSHAWSAFRDWGHCAICSARTYKRPGDASAHCCAKCATNVRALAYLLTEHYLVPLVTREEAQAIMNVPRYRGTLARDRLVFSLRVVHDTREYASQPGPRTYQPRKDPRDEHLPAFVRSGTR